jgi:signal peptidase
LAALAAILLIAVLALAVAVAGIPLVVNGRALSVYGDSMSPTFVRGDVIVVKGVDDPSTVEPGQIISYRVGQAGSEVRTRLVVGEEVWASRRLLITQSNDPQLGEESVAEDQVVGIYLYRLPKLGYAVSWAGQNGAWVFAIGLAAVVVAGVALVVARRRVARARAGQTSGRSTGSAVPPGGGQPQPKPPVAAPSGDARAPRPKPVPWKPGLAPTAAGASRARPGVPTWEDVDPSARPASPRIERLVTTRPETLAKPVAFVPTGPAMEGQSTGELPVRRPRPVGRGHSVANLIPHARVPAQSTGQIAPVEPVTPVSPPPGPAGPPGGPIATRIPRAHTPPGTPPDLPAVPIRRARPFSELETPPRPTAGRHPAGRHPAGAFEPLKRKAAEVMHETGELRLVREASRPRVISHRDRVSTGDQDRPWLDALEERRGDRL